MPNSENDRSSPVRPPLFRRVVAKALANPLNLSVAGASLAGGAALHLWPLAALGGAAYVALVAWDLVSPDFWRKALPTPEYGRPELAQMPDPRKLADPALRQPAMALLASRAELNRIRGEASGDVAFQIAGVMSAVDELEGRAAALLREGDQLFRYLDRTDVDAVRREIDRLGARGAETSDPTARDQYQRSIAARQEQLSALSDIRGAIERVYANLSRIVATIDGMSAKFVRMSAMDAQAMDNLSGDMNAELEKMNQEIDTFEQTLRHLVTVEVSKT
jgi:hypothetical protein